MRRRNDNGTVDSPDLSPHHPRSIERISHDQPRVMVQNLQPRRTGDFGYWIVKLTPVERLTLPLVPVMLSGYVPGTAGCLGEIVKLELPDPTTELGVKV